MNLKELGDASRKAMDAYCVCECHICKDPNRKRCGDSGCIRQRAYYDASAEVVRAQKNHDPSTEWS